MRLETCSRWRSSPDAHIFEKKSKKRKISRSKLLRYTQQAVNSFIRLRDRDLECVSCGGSVEQAGHYRSVGSHPELRFEELNINGQCQRCNHFLSGNLIDYRINLVKRIGVEKVEWLEGPHERKKLILDEIREIRATYETKVRELENSHIVGALSEVG